MRISDWSSDVCSSDLLRDKLTALAAHGLDQVILERFNQKMADMSAKDFIRHLLVQGLNTRWLLVGEDFRYGHKRSGDIELLRRAGQEHGFEVETIADVAEEHGHRLRSEEHTSELQSIMRT